MPYDGPVDPKLHISVDRLAASRQHAEATRASRLIRQVLLKLPHVKRAASDGSFRYVFTGFRWFSLVFADEIHMKSMFSPSFSDFLRRSSARNVDVGRPEDLEKVEEELKGVLEKELEACGTEQAKMQEESGCTRTSILKQLLVYMIYMPFLGPEAAEAPV